MEPSGNIAFFLSDSGLFLCVCVAIVSDMRETWTSYCFPCRWPVACGAAGTVGSVLVCPRGKS